MGSDDAVPEIPAEPIDVGSESPPPEVVVIPVEDAAVPREPRKRAALICPHCRAENLPDEAVCASCGKQTLFILNPAARVPTRIGIGTVMFWIALIGVGLALARELPGLLIIYVLVLTPALIRYGQTIHRRREDWGIESGFADRCVIFAGSVAVVTTILVTFPLAFGIVCFPLGILAFSGGREALAFLAIGLGLLAGCWASYHVGRALWRSRP